MERLHTLLNRNVISTAKVLLLFQIAAYITATGVFAACLFATARFATSPFDAFIGLIASSILAVGLVTLGAVIPLTLRSPNPNGTSVA